MKVLLLTVFLSLLLALIFLIFFALQKKKGYLNNVEQDALRPLDKEQSRTVLRK